ncbi:MAG: M28 family metallopeptidase [Bacillota bacterium]
MRTRSFLLSVLVSALLIAATALAGLRQVEPQPVSQASLRFDAARAMALTGELATRFPFRNDLHPDRERAARWIRGQFREIGLEPRTQTFSEVIQSRKVEGLENIYVMLPGASDEIVVVLAHYDIPLFVEQGAADDASGVAVVLELARIFSQEKPGRTLLLMATDSEEYGAMWGTIQFLRQFPQKEKIVAALTLDFLNMGEQEGIMLRNMGLQRGYAPPWLRDLAMASIRPETKPVESDTLFEWVERSVTIPPTEHGIFLAQGIPAVDLWGIPVDREAQAALYHTANDKIEHLSEAAMANYGRAAERLVRSLAELDAIPQQSGWYLGLAGGRYLAGWSVALIQLWLFLPLIVAVARGWQERRRLAALSRADLRERYGAVAKRLLGLWLPLLAGFALLKLLPEVGLMVKYELYPATQKDPVLDNPQWLPVLLVVATVLLGLWVIGRESDWLRGPESGWEERRLGLLTALLGLILVVWAFGAGFAAVSFLTLPAYLWLGIRPGARWRSVLLWVLSTAIFVTFILLFSLLYKIGVVWWYLLMGASYGLFSVKAVLGFLVGLALHMEALSLAWGEAEAAPVRQRVAV